MIQFRSGGYNLEDLKVLKDVVNDAIKQMQKNFLCCTNDDYCVCEDCPFEKPCVDFVSLHYYLNTIIRRKEENENG